MTPLPGPLASGSHLAAWRLDETKHAPTWDSGIGSELFGGRWSAKGVRAVYCAIDPATAILEVAVHKTFDVLDTKSFTLTCLQVLDTDSVRVVQPSEVPNPDWLHAGWPSAGQQAWGGALLDAHPFVVFPSVVSKQSWNLAFRPDRAERKYVLLEQDRIGIDGRLNPPKP